MNIQLIVALLLFAFMVILASGFPIAFVLLGLALLFTAIFISPAALYMAFTSAYSVMIKDIYLAAPLFIFMATILQFCGVATDLYDMMYKWAGSFRGSLAVATVIICTIIAAMTGLGGTGVVTMGLIAYPEMMKHGYNRSLAIGVITSGSTLGPLIPPSILMVILGGLTNLSVGKLFAGGVLPGLLMSFVFIIYVIIICRLKPAMAPSLPKEELATWREKFIALRGLILPVFIIMGVLGSIWSGAATPTEAASIGAVGAIISAAVHRTLNWNNMKQAMRETIRINAMVIWLLIGGTAFSYFLNASGAGDYIVSLITGRELGIYGTVAVMMLISLVLGCFIDGAAITVICAPIFFPIINRLGIDPLWFGLLFVISLIIGYLTPPFGMNLFYMRGILPKNSGVTMKDIYGAALPFIWLQIIVLILSIMFPAILLWLPSLMK